MRGARILISVLVVTALVAAAGADASRAGSRTTPVVPQITGKVRGKHIATLRRGRRLGNRVNVFAKVGDSISESPAFAQALGCGRWTAQRPDRLRPVVRLFSRRVLTGTSAYCPRVDSFSRNSAATLSGKASDWPLTPGAAVDPSCGSDETPLACEIRLIRPAYALVLIGTNDLALAAALGGDPVPGFVANVTHIVQTARSSGVVPILSTIPRRADLPDSEPEVRALNSAVHAVARRMRAPLIDLWRALEPLPDHGLARDGIHLSLFGGPDCAGPCDPNTCMPGCRPGNLTAAGVAYGYNARNLITALTLSRLADLERLSRNRMGRHG